MKLFHLILLPGCIADNLAIFMCRCLEILGTSNFWFPKVLSRRVQRWLQMDLLTDNNLPKLSQQSRLTLYKLCLSVDILVAYEVIFFYYYYNKLQIFSDIIFSEGVFLHDVLIYRKPTVFVIAAYQYNLQFNSLPHFRISH